jgi:large subunit ribosomal protein L25
MKNIYEVAADLRTDSGKGASRRLRHAGKVPAIMYGGGDAPTSIELDHNKFIRHLAEESFYAHILTVVVDGKKSKVILKDLQRHPTSDVRIMHADFLRINENEKLTITIQLHFMGEEDAPGVKLEGGVFSHLSNDIEIICLPGDLPEYIEVDASEMVLGDSVHFTDLKMPEGVEIVALTHGDHGEELEEGARYSFDQAVLSLHLPVVVVEEEEEVEAVEGEEGEAADGDDSADSTEEASED